MRLSVYPILRRRWFLPLLLAMLATSMFAPVGASAARPNDAARLVEQLQASADPEAEFLRLSTKDQHAVVAFLQVTTVEESREVSRTPVAADGGGLVALAANACWTITKRNDAKNGFGMIMWSYFQKVNWCGNGSTITSTPARTRWGEVYIVFWGYNGHIDSSTSGGYGSTFYQTFTQGKFSLCPPLLGCTQYRYPWIDMTVRPNGTVTGSMGG